MTSFRSALAIYCVFGSLNSVALAQTSTRPTSPQAASQNSIDPAARELLDRATTTYKGVKGLFLKTSLQLDGKETKGGSISFQRPNLLRVDSLGQLMQIDGTNFYLVAGTIAYTNKWTGDVSQIYSHGTGGGVNEQILNMLDGKSPLDAALEIRKDALPPDNAHVSAKALTPQLIDGDVLQGVRLTVSIPVSVGTVATRRWSFETTMWFGGPQTLLRRVQTRSTVNGKTQTRSEKISDQLVDPTLSPYIFKFNGRGLRVKPFPSFK